MTWKLLLTGGCLLLNECRLHYFHAAISNHLSEKPKKCLVLYGRLTQVKCLNLQTHKMFETVITLKFKQRGLSTEKFVQKAADRMTNKVDPDLTVPLGEPYLGL